MKGARRVSSPRGDAEGAGRAGAFNRRVGGAFLLAAFVFLLTTAVALAATSGSALAAGPIANRHKTDRGTSLSTNWSGYATYDTTFSHVKGDWTVPSADCSGARGSTIATAWVGLDGFFSSTVEQAGTDTDCKGNTPFYIAWYEFFPKSAVFLKKGDYPVAPGDPMHAEVSVSGGTATLTLQNLSSAHGWTLTPSPSLMASSLAFSSAEWIMEGFSKLTDFGTVSFSNAAATDGSTTNGAISAFTNDSITMVTKNKGVTRATPSALTSGGTAFSVTFNHP